jgi:peptide/nickel transport system substrate-binding protein
MRWTLGCPYETIPHNRETSRMIKRALLAAAVTLCAAAPVLAQGLPRNTLVVLRTIDSDRYDPHRTTARSGGEVLYMLSDTLVSLDWDLQTVRPGLAREWTVSEDGRTYTFTLRADVTFCDGRPMTADDVVYSMNRWIGRTTPRVVSPVAWRAGKVKEIRATGPHTVEYELEEPFSELLYQLTLFFASIVDRATVERLGENFGVQGFNGTGPYCWVSWTPRQDMTIQKHPTYTWAPPIYTNPSPQIDRITWRIIPEQNTRIAALQTGQGDVTQYIPYSWLDRLRRTPGIALSNQPNYLWDYFVGFRVDKPVMNDPVIRRAINMAVDRKAIAEAVFFGAGDAADTILNPRTLDFYNGAPALAPPLDQASANRLLDDSGWRRGPDGVRVKEGQRASFVLYGIQSDDTARMMEAVQADLRRIGIDMRIQLFDATVAWGRLATQEFDAFTMSYPYVSAGDSLNLYFRSSNTPTPNRMNWRDAQTDAWLDEGRSALTAEARARAYGNVQRQLQEANVWLPMVREQLWVASTRRVQGVRAHGIYGVALYKGLDLRLAQ